MITAPTPAAQADPSASSKQPAVSPRRARKRGRERQKLVIRNTGEHAIPGRPKARFIAIAGNIGAGKSTLTSFLESRYGIQPFYEPNDSNPYLPDFYADMERYAFHSQMYFLQAKFRAHLQLAGLLQSNPGTVFVQDRTIYEDAEIFAATLHRQGVMNDRDFATYMAFYEAILGSLPKPDLLIYLRCTLRGIRRRIAHRGRVEEQDIDLAYLKRLNRAYGQWHRNYTLGPSLVIDTERLDYLENLFDRLDLMRSLEAVIDGDEPVVPG